MDHFNILELPLTERKLSDVKSAYRRLAMKYHPDKAGPAGLESMKRINVAYHTIIDLKLYDPDTHSVPQTNDSKPSPDQSGPPNKANKPQHEEPTIDQKWNEQIRMSHDVWILRSMRRATLRTRQDLIKTWRDDVEHSETLESCLEKYDLKIATIDQRIAEITAERAAFHEKARQKWEEEMLASAAEEE